MDNSTGAFVRQHRIRSSAEWVDSNPHMIDSRDMNHYRVTLRMAGRQMTTYFSMGYAHTDEPTAAQVLDCLASDASGIDQDFESWAGDYGYDTDSRKAERTYNTIRRQSARLERFLGNALYLALLNGERD